MRAITIRTFGSPDGMHLSDLPEPTPGAGELRIRVAAIGVGGVDAVIRRGGLGTFGFEEGLVPGSEVAGVVESVGTGVDESWIGRRVWAFTGTAGGYLEHAVAASVDDVTELPEGLSELDAVTLGSAAPVAHFGLERARLAAGERVLVRGAAGSIGIAAVELAARAGASVVAVSTSSAERGERLRELGATQVLGRGLVPLDSHSTSGTGRERPASPAAAESAAGAASAETASSEFDVILDIVGGPGLADVIGRLAPNGRLVAVGVVGGFPPPEFGAALLAGFRRSISFGTLSLDTIERDTLADERARLLAAAVRGELTPVVQEVLPLERAAEAHRRMDAGEVFGRFVLVP
ncbi:zinc-binding dehydrogenase [Schumannella soli]|uniref:Zinc-binding dehydrogenase n=1 Tax=Schumannella soli TaxID=2590779 RepID=A0A506Y9J7_9MICO|nr:zinc-binding dehydrogenase [Schumannella soli]TPW77777.1 zinc-binding dehydrogenase [Schumannella soli]